MTTDMPKPSSMRSGDRLTKEVIRMKNKTKKTKRIISIMLTAMLILSLMSVGVFAAGTVSYDGKDKGFSFGPVSSSSGADLLPSFKGLMPGDSRSEDVTITNNSKKTVEISVRSIGAADNQDFVSQLNFKVNGNSDMVRLSGSHVWLSLGKFAPGESKTVNVALEMPTSVGNKYQDAEGTLTWQFAAEEEDDDEDGSGGADTGDDTNMYIWIGIGALAALATVGFARRRKQKV